MTSAIVDTRAEAAAALRGEDWGAPAEAVENEGQAGTEKVLRFVFEERGASVRARRALCKLYLAQTEAVFTVAGVMLATELFTPGDWRVCGSDAVRALATLSGPEVAPFFPAPPASTARLAHGEAGDGVEVFEGVSFSTAVLVFVRGAHPGVTWTLDDQRRERVLYGFVGALLVAIVCEVRT